VYQGGCTGMIFRFHPKDLTANEDELPPPMAKDFIGITVFGIKDFSGKLKTGPGHKASFSSGFFSDTSIQSTSRAAVGVKSRSTNLTKSDLPRADFHPREKLKDPGLEYAAEP
jgi:hypothetical protein